jgi:hypothetical protein
MSVVGNRIPGAAGHEAAFEEEVFAGPNVFEMHEIIHAAEGSLPLSGVRP